MSEEMFDVVDEHDNVVYQQRRSIVHRDRLRHRAVHIFVVRSDGRMLVHKRSDTKEEFPSVWTSSASGHVSAGEEYELAAERELHEELGIRGILQRHAKFEACVDTSMEFTVLYLTQSDDRVRFDPEEISEIRWLSANEIHHWLTSAPEEFSPAFRLLFDSYRSRPVDGHS